MSTISTGPAGFWGNSAAFFSLSTSNFDYNVVAPDELNYFSAILNGIDLFKAGSTFTFKTHTDTAIKGHDLSVQGNIIISGTNLLGSSGTISKAFFVSDDFYSQVHIDGLLSWALPQAGVMTGTASYIDIVHNGKAIYLGGSLTIDGAGHVTGIATTIGIGSQGGTLDMKGNINLADGSGVINTLELDGSSGIGGFVLRGAYSLDTILAASTVGSFLNKASIFSGSDGFSVQDAQRAWHGFDGNDTMTSGAGNDHFFGDAGNDTLDGGGGNDTLDGGGDDDTLKGGIGNDLYKFNAVTGGHDTVIETGGRDKVWITGGVTIDGISASASGNDLRIASDQSAYSVIISNQRIAGDTQVETLKFDDGFYVPLVSVAAWLKGSAGNDAVILTTPHEAYAGGDGDDDVTGTAHNDYIHGGAGDDILHGGGGNDILHGGAGNDAIYGQAGNDVLFGGAGADLFVFDAASYGGMDTLGDFSTLQADKLDIRGLLIGFDPVHSAIADFVRMTSSGNNTVFSIDRDGADGAYAFTQIATLVNVTSLDPATLITSNILIMS
jgi:Ca2+-binding RTX toxin-like protein